MQYQAQQYVGDGQGGEYEDDEESQYYDEEDEQEIIARERELAQAKDRGQQ